MNPRLKKLRSIFLKIFLLTSLLSILIFFFVPVFNSAPGPEPAPESNMAPAITFLISIASAVISLLGFLITTALSFRREKREARESDLSIRHKEIELEKAQLELEQLKKKAAGKGKKP